MGSLRTHANTRSERGLIRAAESFEMWFSEAESSRLEEAEISEQSGEMFCFLLQIISVN